VHGYTVYNKNACVGAERPLTQESASLSYEDEGRSVYI